MRTRALWPVVVALLLSSLLFQGCVTMPDFPRNKHIPLKNKDLTSLAPLRIAFGIPCVRSCTDKAYDARQEQGVPVGVPVWCDGGHTASTTLLVVTSAASPLIGVIGGTIADSAVRAREKALMEETKAAGVPGYHELVMKKFVERASKEIPGWPPMVVEEQPVSRDLQKSYLKNDFLKTKAGSLLLLEAYPILHTSSRHGFESSSRAAIYISDKDFFWLKDFVYESKNYRRNLGFEEYKADNFKLLKEEMAFAAEATVSDFIQTILKEIGPPEVSAQTEREQGVLSTEKQSQEQTQIKEATKDYGIISITSDPPGAKIFIDGEFKGQTPAEISLNTGTYQIFLQRQLYEPYKDSLTIEKGRTKTLNIELVPEGRGKNE